MGRRSRRAPESAVTGSSLLPREQSQGAFGQGIDGETAVLVEGVLLGAEKESFAAARSGGVEVQDALDEGVCFGRQAIGRTNLRDQADLLRAVRVDGLAEQNERKSEAGKRVFTEIGQDGGRGEAVAHLGEREISVLRDEREVAHDREAKAETEGVALDLRDADQGRRTKGGFELDDTSRFAANGRRRASGTLASSAENGAARSNTQDAGARS